MSGRRLVTVYANQNAIDVCDCTLGSQMTDLLKATNIPDIMWPNMLEYIQAKIRLSITEREVEAAKQKRYDDVEVEEIRSIQNDT